MESKTKVVNVRVKHIRPKYQNLKEWCEDPNNVYIARQGIVFIDNRRYPPDSSIFANPYKVGRDGTIDEVLVKYYNHIAELVNSGQITREQFLALEGKNLGCWCKPDKCHGDILVHILENLM